MKVYQLTDKDFEALLTAIDRDPKHGFSGGGSMVLPADEMKAYQEAHRFYNYQIRKWLEGVTS